MPHGPFMQPAITLIAATVLSLALAGCGSLPAQRFEHSAGTRIKRICVAPLGTPERAQVQIMNPIGAGFGVVGTFIESRRAAGASQEMEDTLTAARYDFRAALANSVVAALAKDGFAVTRVCGNRSEKERARFLARYPAAKRVDAYLDVYATYVGFEAPQSSTAYRPRLELAARLVSAKDHRTLFQSRIVYAWAENIDEDSLLIPADENPSFRDRAALRANPTRTARALQSAIDAVAWELARQLI